MNRIRRLLAILLILLLLPVGGLSEDVIRLMASDYPVEKNGWYSSMEEVAVYIASYHKLPGNYITKNQAMNLGWSSSAGNLGKVAKGKSIGGDRFDNYEGQLPGKGGRTWKECDIDYTGGYRNGQRIVFSSDWLIYYTGDHYNTFTRVLVDFATPTPAVAATPAPVIVEEDGLYTDRDHVALYLHEFWGLPANYITKDEARELGWSNKKDNLAEVAPGFTIGGDEFGNREGLLPSAPLRTWYECDVNRDDGRRSKERIVFSSDGLIYYTDDGFKSFTQLY